MKAFFLVFLSLMIFQAGTYSQTPAVIHLKDGSSIEVSHFGQLNCGGTQYFSSNIIIRGRFHGSITEINDFSTISRIDLINFTRAPEKPGSNERGNIAITRTSGVTGTLEEATINLSCYGTTELYNQLKFQIINPLTDKKAEATVDTKDIAYIVFR